MKTREEFKKSIVEGLEQRSKVEAAVKDLYGTGVKNVYMVGCGGSLAVMMPMQFLISKYSELRAEVYNSNEFVHMKPKAFSKDSLYITSSYTGTTPETVAAAQYAKDCGARIIAFTGNLESPLAKLSDFAFSCGSKLIIMYQIVFHLLHLNGDFPQYEAFQQALNQLPDQVYDAMEAAQDKAQEFADTYHDEKFFFVTGSGACYGEAYTYGCCLLEEMQWIYGQSSHAGEFFHGPFEMLTEDSAILILMAEGSCRELDERVLSFAKRYTKKIIVADMVDYRAQTPALSGELREIFCPFLMTNVLSVYSDALAEKRNHPLSTRRYMFKVEY